MLKGLLQIEPKKIGEQKFEAYESYKLAVKGSVFSASIEMIISFDLLI